MMYTMTKLLLVLLCHTLRLSFAEESKAWNTNQCPESCQCLKTWSEELDEMVNTVDCTDAGLVAFPALPESTHRAILAGNAIHSWTSAPSEGEVGEGDATKANLDVLVDVDLSRNGLKTSDLPMVSRLGARLRRLSLAGNSLVFVEQSHLLNMPNLINLNLSDNALTHVTIFPNKRLRTLSLFGNRLSHFAPNAFKLTTKLQTLDLSRNRFSKLDAGMLPLSLRVLKLSQNRFRTITSSRLGDLSHLTDLDLSHNSLIYFTAQDFRGGKLEVLRLDANPLFSLGSDHFKDLPNLRELTATAMPQLHMIERHAFRDLPRLRLLALCDNPRLRFLHDQAIDGAPKLTDLFLHNTNLRTISHTLIKPLSGLREITLYDTPLHCGCHLQWLQDAIKVNPENTQATLPNTLIVIDGKSMKCSTPAAVQDSYLTNADLSVDCRPMVIPPPAEKVVVNEGDSVTLPCYVSDATNIYWSSPHGVNITADPRETVNAVHEANLHIPVIQRKDSGLYECVAEGKGSVQPVTSVIFVEVSPEKFAIGAVKVSPESILVKWAVPTVGFLPHPDDHYITWTIVSEPHQSDSMRKSKVNLQEGQFEISGARPGVEYRVCLTFEKETMTLERSCVSTKTLEASATKILIHQRIEETHKKSFGTREVLVAVFSSACTLVLLAMVAIVLRMRAKRQRASVYDKLGRSDVSIIEPLCDADRCYNPTTTTRTTVWSPDIDRWSDAEAVRQKLLDHHNM